MDYGCCFCHQFPAFYLLQLYFLTFLTLANTFVLSFFFFLVDLCHVYGCWVFSLLHGAMLIGNYLVDSEQQLLLNNILPFDSSINSLYDIWRLCYKVN